MMKEFSVPMPRRCQAEVNGHLVSLAWFADHYEIAYCTGGRWSDPIWEGSEHAGKGALLAVKRWLEANAAHHPEEIGEVAWTGTHFEVLSWGEIV